MEHAAVPAPQTRCTRRALTVLVRGDAFRVVYALHIDADIWVVHAFQKKSNTGIKTPKQEIELIRERRKRLREMLKWATI